MNGRPKLRAVNIVTADPVRLAEFYRDVLVIDATEPCDLPWGYRYFHIKDPDGNGIDLVQKL